MRKIPFEIGTIHFSGIGGIGMSGIAEVMHNLGYKVQGSDITENANVIRLRESGIKVIIGQNAENIDGVSALVISTAISMENTEVKAAREHLIPVVRRADMLAELMRLKWCVSVAGTHGKTTTTSMVASVVDGGGFDPTVINGGIINSYGTNARIGEGDWMVVEADESDGSFIKLPATIGIVTNMDPEHLDFYGNFEAIKAAFKTFIEKVPFYGAAILCVDHPEVKAMIPHILDRKIISYGFSALADVQIKNVKFQDGSSTFDVELSERFKGGARTIEGINLPMPGMYNVQNATAAIAVGLQMLIPDEKLKISFDDFKGVKRRFTKVGVENGVTIIDDYGHHPVEISAALNAAREAYKGKITAIVQPHRYTRLKSLFEGFCTAFNDADSVIVAPVYEAGEKLIPGFNHLTLTEGLKNHGHRHARSIESPGEIAAIIKDLCKPGDLVIYLGAGSITHWAYALPGALRDLNEGGGT